MEYKDILTQVLTFLGNLNSDKSDKNASLSASTQLSETALIDSLSVIQIVMFIEKEFNLAVDRKDLDYIDTPENIAKLILRKSSIAK